MIIRFAKNHYKKFIIFCFVGGLSFVIDWLFFNLFYFLTLGFVISITLSWIVSMIFNFVVNRNVTFSARGASVRRQMFRWLTVYTIAFLARIGMGKGILRILGESTLNANIAFFSGLALSIPISFLGSLLWAFRKPHK